MMFLSAELYSSLIAHRFPLLSTEYCALGTPLVRPTLSGTPPVYGFRTGRPSITPKQAVLRPFSRGTAIAIYIGVAIEKTTLEATCESKGLNCFFAVGEGRMS